MVGRMQTVKNQLRPAGAFVSALVRQPALRGRLRMVMVGSGPLRDECRVEGISNTTLGATGCDSPTQIDRTDAGQDRGSMGAAGCQRTEQWFSLDAMVEAFQSLYFQVLAANIQ